MNLGAIFEPVPVPEFLGDYYGAGPLHSPGTAGRFDFLESGPRAAECSCGECAKCSPALGLAWSLERHLEAPLRPERVRDWNVSEPHRAEQDLIVLQVAGPTSWRTYGSDAQASEAPGWEARLETGGALYLPRSWWRSAHPLDQPTVSWFFHIRNPTGADLLLWLADKMKDSEVFQTDIPRFASLSTQVAYLAKLRRAFGGAFRTPGLLEAHARRLNRLAPLHPPPGRAWSEDLPPDHSIVLATPRVPRIFRRDRDTVYLTAGGKELLFPADAAPLLQYILDRAPVAMAEFYSQFKNEFEHEDLALFLAALSRDRVVAFQAPEQAHS